MRFAGRVAALVVLWLLAWGEVTVGRVAGGIVVASLLLVVFPPGPPADITIHPLGVARLLGYIGVQLVASNIVMSWQIVHPRPTLVPGVLAHHLQHPSAEVVTAMTSVIALSPGTMTVDTAQDSSVIYVHFLFLDDLQAARRSLARLERLVVAAIGTDTGVSPTPRTQEESW